MTSLLFFFLISSPRSSADARDRKLMLDSSHCNITEIDVSRPIDALKECKGNNLIPSYFMPTPLRIQSIEVDDLNNLLKRFKRIQYPLIIENIIGVCEFNLPVLAILFGNGHFALLHSKMVTINFQKLQDIAIFQEINSTIGRGFQFVGNENLSALRFPTLTALHIKFDILIDSNNQLRNIAFPELSQIIAENFIIKRNNLLDEISFSKEHVLYISIDPGRIEIRGNPRLAEDNIQKLKQLWGNNSKTSIQDYGECTRSEPVRNLTALARCRYIYGDLRLADGATGKTKDIYLSRVEGDVFTADLPIEKLDFLKNVRIEGLLESSLCGFDYSLFDAARTTPSIPCTEVPTTTTESHLTVSTPTTKSPLTTSTPTTSTSISSFSIDPFQEKNSTGAGYIQKIPAQKREELKQSDEEHAIYVKKMVMILVGCLLGLILVIIGAVIYFHWQKRIAKEQYKVYKKSKELKEKESKTEEASTLDGAPENTSTVLQESTSSTTQSRQNIFI